MATKKSFMAKAKNAVKQSAITVISDSFACTHFVLDSLKQGCERAEASLIHPLTGQDKREIIVERLHSTYETRKLVRTALKEAEDKLKFWSQVNPGSSDDVIIETDNHGNA